MRNQLETARQRETETRSRLAALEQRAGGSPADEVTAGDAAADLGSAAASTDHAGAAGSPQLVATLRARLIEEQRQRARLERDLKRVQEETSAGPFENKLQTDLQAAHDEIDQLRRTLQSERQERQKLAQRYEALQRQLEAAAAPAPAPGEAQREEIAALKERQQRVLASIQRDLAASQQREQELRDTLAATQGKDGLPLAESVGNLRAENQALQARLDDEHQRNNDLAGKLKIASRVTELIFKMQTASGGSEAAPASEVSAPLP